jgi:hypothetical protein
MSRTAFIVAAAAGALLLQVVTSDAQTSKPSNSRQVNSVDAARAQSRDPAGNYRNYPTWAQFALSGSGRTR